MTAQPQQPSKPLFFVHTIDPILWPFLMVFIRPFFRIVCFQYRHIKEIGFERLKISVLSPHEFEDCQIAGLKFAKTHRFAELCAIHGTITDKRLDFTNYFAKEILRSYTDLLLSARMIRKLPDPHGVFVLTRQFFGRHLRKQVEISISEASGLKCVQMLWMVFRWLQIPLRIVLAFFTFGAAVAAIILQKKKTPPVNLDGKIMVVANNAAELQSDFLRQLSAGFMIDGETIKKDDVVFMSRRSAESGEWRKQGFHVYNVVDLAGAGIHVQAVLRLIALCLTHPRLAVGLVVFFPQWVMYYLVVSDILISKHRFRGLIYTNSDVAIEPMFSAPCLARHIPVVLFFYSASTFPNVMWSYLQADHIFVWNKDMIEFLTGHLQMPDKKFFVSGPLMQVEDQFQPAQLQSLRAEFKVPCDAQTITVGIFDIPPMKTSHVERVRFVQNPKLTRELHRDFLFDIFSLSQSADVRVMLKPKRWTAQYDLSPDINEFLDRHQEKTILLPSQLNPQIAIQSCQLVICFPFTSVFFAALQKGIPAIFYYPFPDEKLREVSHLQKFTVYGKDNLARWFADFRKQTQPSLPPAEKTHELCGLGPGIGVRKHFISQLADIIT